jgi:hypothetical protein
MKINEFILKNEKLAEVMTIFSDEIDKLEKLRDLFKRSPDQESGPNPILSALFNRKLKRAKEQFAMLNDAYDKDAHNKADKNTPVFISEALTEIKYIQEVFTKLRYENSHKWN